MKRFGRVRATQASPLLFHTAPAPPRGGGDGGLQVAQGGQALADDGGFFGRFLRLHIAELFEFGKDTPDALSDALFAGFDDQFGMLRFLIRVVYSGKAGDLAFVYQFVQPFDVALPAHFDGTFDVDLDKGANLFSCPLARLAIRGDGCRDADHAVARQQSAHKGDAFDVGVTVLAAETQSFGEMGAHAITIEDLDVAPSRFEPLFDGF